MAEVVTDAISHTKEELQPYFDQTKSQVMNQITGKTNKWNQSQTMSIEFQLSNIDSFAKLHIFFLKCIFTYENSKNFNKTPVFAQIIFRFCNNNQGLFSNHFYLVVCLQVFFLLISGQIVTDAMSLGNIHGLSRVIPHITECMALLGNQQNVSVLCSMVNCFASRIFQM